MKKSLYIISYLDEEKEDCACFEIEAYSREQALYLSGLESSNVIDVEQAISHLAFR